MYEIMICPIKQLYQYAEDGDMSDVAVLAVSSYDINEDRLKGFGRTLCLNFADVTDGAESSAFKKGIADEIAAYVKDLPNSWTPSLSVVIVENQEAQQCQQRL